jgi:hypothetical protein
VSFEFVKVEPNIIVENVKINKTIFVEKYIPEEWLHLMKNVTRVIKRLERSSYVCIVIVRKIPR